MLLRLRKHLSVPTQPAACSGSHWGRGSGCCPGLWQLSCLYRTLLWLLALPPEGEEETSSVSIAEAVKDSSRLPGYKPAWRVGLRLAKCEVFPVPEALIHYQGEWEPCVSHWPTGTYWILFRREIFYTSSGTLRSFYVSCLVLQPIFVLDVSKCPIWFVLPYFYCTTRLRFVFYILLETVKNIQIEMWFNIKYM